MVNGLELFKEHFKDFADQYVLIGGTACDVNFEMNASTFRATKDLDMVLIIEALTPEFAKSLWQFIKEGKYRNKAKNDGSPQFYRFDKPEDDRFPKMIELFGRTEFNLAEMNDITPIHIDDDISSLSAILLSEDYYRCLLKGKTIENGLSILRPEYLILFKAKAHMDLKARKEAGEKVKSGDITKHHKDVLRLTAEMVLNRVDDIPITVRNDMKEFIDSLKENPFNIDVLESYGLSNEEVRDRLIEIYL